MSKVARRKPTLEGIKRLQAVMSKLPQLDLSQSTQHLFANGMYCRTLAQPEDSTIVGKTHRHEHFFMVISGEVTLAGDGYRERIKAPAIFVSKPGTKRSIYAHTDCMYLTVHRTDKTDLDEIEADLIEPEEMPSLFDSSNKPVLRLVEE